MKKYQDAQGWRFITALIIAVILLQFGCNTSKKAAQDIGQTSNLIDSVDALKQKVLADEQAAKARIIAEWIKENPPVFPELNLDSLCHFCEPSPTDHSGSDYSDAAKNIEKPNRILVPFEDKRHVKLLQDSVAAIKTRLKECEAKAIGKTEATKEILPQVLKHGKWEFNNWSWIAIGSSILLLIGIIIAILRSKKNHSLHKLEHNE